MTAPGGRLPGAIRGLFACPLCTGRLDWIGAESRCVCGGCTAGFPVDANGLPDFLTEAVLERLRDLCGTETRVDRWAATRLALERWRERKASHAGKQQGFAEKLTQDHRLPSDAITRYLELRALAVGGAILDVGCGTAFRARHFQDSTYVGIDPSECVTAVSAAAVRGLGEYLPFHARSFDLVLCVDVLDHVAEPQRVLSEMLRVTRPGGHLYVSVGDATHPVFRSHREKRSMFGMPEHEAHLGEFDSAFFRQSMHSASDWLDISRDNGFLLIRARRRKG